MTDHTPVPPELAPGSHLLAESVSAGVMSLWRYTKEPVPLSEIERLCAEARLRGASDDSPSIWGHVVGDDSTWHLSVECPRHWTNGYPSEVIRQVEVIPGRIKTLIGVAWLATVTTIILSICGVM